MKIREWLFKKLFGAEWLALSGEFQARDKAESALAELRREFRQRGIELEQLQWRLGDLRRQDPPKPAARFQLADAMPPAQIAQALGGQESTPVIKAIVAYLSAKIVDLSDKATDVPRDRETLADGRVLPAFTETERLHFCGQTSGVAEVLADLQAMTAPQTEEAEKK